MERIGVKSELSVVQRTTSGSFLPDFMNITTSLLFKSESSLILTQEGHRAAVLAASIAKQDSRVRLGLGCSLDQNPVDLKSSRGSRETPVLISRVTGKQNPHLMELTVRNEYRVSTQLPHVLLMSVESCVRYLVTRRVDVKAMSCVFFDGLPLARALISSTRDDYGKALHALRGIPNIVVGVRSADVDDSAKVSLAKLQAVTNLPIEWLEERSEMSELLESSSGSNMGNTRDVSSLGQVYLSNLRPKSSQSARIGSCVSLLSRNPNGLFDRGTRAARKQSVVLLSCTNNAEADLFECHPETIVGKFKVQRDWLKVTNEIRFGSDMLSDKSGQSPSHDSALAVVPVTSYDKLRDIVAKASCSSLPLSLCVMFTHAPPRAVLEGIVKTSGLVAVVQSSSEIRDVFIKAGRKWNIPVRDLPIESESAKKIRLCSDIAGSGVALGSSSQANTSLSLDETRKIDDLVRESKSKNTSKLLGKLLTHFVCRGDKIRPSDFQTGAMSDLPRKRVVRSIMSRRKDYAAILLFGSLGIGSKAIWAQRLFDALGEAYVKLSPEKRAQLVAKSMLTTRAGYAIDLPMKDAVRLLSNADPARVSLMNFGCEPMMPHTLPRVVTVK